MPADRTGLIAMRQPDATRRVTSEWRRHLSDYYGVMMNILLVLLLATNLAWAEPSGAIYQPFQTQESLDAVGIPVKQLECSRIMSREHLNGAGYFYSNTALTEVSYNTGKAYYRIKAVSDVRFLALSDKDQQEFLTNSSFKRIAQKTGCECSSASEPGCRHGGPYHEDMYVAKVSKPKVVQCWRWNYTESKNSLTGRRIRVETAPEKVGLYVVCGKTNLQGRTSMPAEDYDSYEGLRAVKKYCDKCEGQKENSPGVEIYDNKAYEVEMSDRGYERISPFDPSKQRD